MLGLVNRRSGILAALFVSACATAQPTQIAKLTVQSGAQTASVGASVPSTAPTSTTSSSNVATPSSTAPRDTGSQAPSDAASAPATASTAPAASPSAAATGNTGSSGGTPTPPAGGLQSDAGGGTGTTNNGSATGQPTPTSTSSAAPVAAIPSVTTFAGNGQAGFIDGNAVDAKFTTPQVLSAMGTSSLYVADGSDHRIRRIDLITSGNPVRTIAGTGAASYRDGIGQGAAFNTILGLALDAQGLLYVADSGNKCIRKVDATDPGNATVTTFAGVRGVAGHRDDLSSQATFDGLGGLAIASNTLYVSDANNHCIRAIDLATPGNPVSTYAGSGINGILDGNASTAQFKTPVGLAVDGQGNLYISDTAAHNIRMISAADPSHAVKTIAGDGTPRLQNGNGTSSSFNGPTALSFGSDGNLYVSDTGNNAVRMIKMSDPNYSVTTYAGTGIAGFVDATAPNAQFRTNQGISWVGSTLFLADGGNARVRKIQ